MHTRPMYAALLSKSIIHFPLLRTQVPRLRVSYYRQHTAPSIPSAGQNCGYDENNAGSLQPLDTPQRDATLGPAYYKVSYVRQL